MVIRHSDLRECKFLSRLCPPRAMRVCKPAARWQCGSQEVDLKLPVSAYPWSLRALRSHRRGQDDSLSRSTTLAQRQLPQIDSTELFVMSLASGR